MCFISSNVALQINLSLVYSGIVNMHSKFLIVIAGPTAIGKTTTAIEVARALGTEIISCDSRQLYKELNIGVAKPSQDELDAVKHHFINHISIEQNYSAGQYEKEAISQITELFKSHTFVVLTGGTGLYMRAILSGLDDFPEVAEEDAAHYNNLFEKEGITALQTELKLKDPTYYREVDLYNSRRLVRALSVIKSSGQTFSSFRNAPNKQRSFTPIAFQLTMNRDNLYDRINQRVDIMMQDGLLDEVTSLIPYQSLKSLDTVGYTELFKYLNKEIDLPEALRLIKRNTRRYAKRQITWLNNQTEFDKIASGDIDRILREIETKTGKIPS